MNRFIALFISSLSFVSMVFAQTQEERTKKSDAIMVKVRRIDMINQILPLAMTKKQLGDVLTAVEKARANAEKTKRLEFDTLKAMESDLDVTIANALDKGQLPAADVIKKIANKFALLDINRNIAIAENVKTVSDAMNTILNKGQVKAASNALDLSYFEPSVKASEWTPDKKFGAYVKYVILDPVAYDFMKELFKAAKE